MKDSTQTMNNDLAKTIHDGRAASGSKKRLYWASGLVLLGLGFWLFTSTRANGTEGGIRYTSEPIQRGAIRLTVTATGNLEPTNEVSVGSELSGTTLEVYVDSNDHVTKGEALAVLDTSTLENELKASRATLESAKAKVSQAEATLKETEATLARQQDLHERSGGRIPSQANLDASVAAAARARADLLSAEAARGEAEAQVEVKESDLSKAIIRSPSDGIVLTRSIEPGQTVAASFETPELFVIAEDLSQMKLEVAVAEADIGRVEATQTASFQVDAWPDRSYEATVQKVSYGSEVTDNVVTYATELSVNNEDLSLRPGMTATADIYVAHHEDVLLVPVAALRFNPTSVGAAAGSSGAASGEKKSFIDNLIPRPPRRDNRPSGEDLEPVGKAVSAVWVLRNQVPQRIEVKTGLTDGRFTEVEAEGLEAGDLIIIRENQMGQ